MIVQGPLRIVGAPTGGGAFGNPLNALTLTIALMAIASIVMQIISIIGLAAGFVYLRRLVLRLPRRAIATQLRIIMWGLITAIVLLTIASAIQSLVIFPALAGVMPAPPAPSAAPPNPFSSSLFTALAVLSTVSCFTGLAFIAFGIWSIVLLFTLAVAFRAASARARLTWSAAQ